MKFMDTEIFEGPVLEVDTENGTEFVPLSVITNRNPLEWSWLPVDDQLKLMEDFLESDIGNVNDWNVTTMIIGRLSAPGYLDCTEWTGPFATIDEAESNINDLYGMEEDDED